MKFNFTERIKKINFGSGFDDDSDKFNINISDEDLAEIKVKLMMDENDEEFIKAFNEAYHSNNILIKLGSDVDFIKDFKRKHGETKRGKFLIDCINTTRESLEAVQKKKLKNTIKTKAALAATQGIASAIISGLDEPAKGFIEGMFNMLTQLGVDLKKIKEISDDDTKFKFIDKVDDMTEKKGTFKKVVKESGVPTDDSTTESSDMNPKDNDIKSLDEKEFIAKVLEKNFRSTPESDERILSMKSNKKFMDDFKKAHKGIYNRLFGPEKKNFAERIHDSFINLK